MENINNITKKYNADRIFCSYTIEFNNSNMIKSVPLDPANTDYQAIQKWIAEGGEVIDNPPTE